jgi:hypothetical protein
MNHLILLSVIKQNPPFEDGMKSIKISYGIREKLDERLNSKEKIKQWEKNRNAELWYGFYNGELRIEMEIRNATISSANVEEVMQIHGYKVQMSSKKFKTGKSALFADINLEDGSFSCMIILDDEFHKEDALSWLTTLLEQLKEK